jgi:hypothetical protein
MLRVARDKEVTSSSDRSFYNTLCRLSMQTTCLLSFQDYLDYSFLGNKINSETIVLSKKKLSLNLVLLTCYVFFVYVLFVLSKCRKQLLYILYILY